MLAVAIGLDHSSEFFGLPTAGQHLRKLRYLDAMVKTGVKSHHVIALCHRGAKVLI